MNKKIKKKTTNDETKKMKNKKYVITCKIIKQTNVKRKRGRMNEKGRNKFTINCGHIIPFHSTKHQNTA